MCYPLPRIRTLSQKMEHILCQGLAPSLPFQRGVLSQGQFLPFVKGCFPFLKGHALKRMCSSHPFSRDALSQGVPFLKGCPFSRAFGNLPFCKGSILLQGSVLVSFPFPEGCPKSSRAKVNTLLQGVSFCKEHPFSRIDLAISLLQGTSFLKDCLWQTPFFKGHPFSRASLGNCPFARAILLQGLCARVSLSQGIAEPSYSTEVCR